MRFVNTIETDVIVIGSGMAGLYAALHAAPMGRVALLSKGHLSTSNSMWAQGGIAAALAPDDAPSLHLADTLVAGRDLCSLRAAEALVYEGPACIQHLIGLGLPFDREVDGRLALGLEGGHERRRIVHAQGVASGAVITSALAEIVLRQPSVALYEEMTVVGLLETERKCGGVRAYHAPTQSWWHILAPSTILASGGLAGLYPRSTNPSLTRGDGVALAYRAGAAVADLEFVQFHPTALVTETGQSFLLSEAIRGEGAHLLNTRGERFMPRYHPQGELAPRDVVSRAIVSEMRATGSDHVLLDLAPIAPAVIRHHFATLYDRCRALGLDMLREPLPVAPAAHYAMGGVLTDLNGATNLPGLFACGEVACTGVQGANRLASNSLLECLVFGRRSGLVAAQHASEAAKQLRLASPAPLDSAVPAPTEADRLLGELLWEHAGLVRDGEGLQRLLAEIERLAAAATSALSRGSLLVASLIAQAALLRTESRGGHCRADFPESAQVWERRIVFQQGQAPAFAPLEQAEESWAAPHAAPHERALAAYPYEAG